MSTPSRRRLLRDFKRIQDDPPVGVSASPTDDDIMRQAFLSGASMELTVGTGGTR